MVVKDFIIRYLLIILGGFLIFYIDSLEFVDDIVTKIILLVLILFKTGFFVVLSYRKVIDASRKNVAYHNFLAFMAINISMIIASFGIDFLCLYHVDHSAFIGIPAHLSFPRKIFEFMYFSMFNFSNFGYGEVYPIGILGKITVGIEILISFASIIFILSDFVSLKESFAENDYKFKLGENNIDDE